MELNEAELAMIFVVSSLLEKGETFITPDMIALKMSLSFEEVDNYFTELIKRCYFSIDKECKLSIDNLINILESSNKTEIIIEEKDDEKKEIFHYIENEFARALSEAEVNTINDWIKSGITLDKIKEAFNIATVAKAKSIRYIDKILLEWQRKEEYRKHGKSMSNKWDENIDEALEIAKINWIED